MKEQTISRSEYKNDVFEYLNKMPCCVKDLPINPDRKKQFIEVAKEYIDQQACVTSCVEFTSDMTQVRKFQVNFKKRKIEASPRKLTK